MTYPISNRLETSMHMFPIHMSAFTLFLMIVAVKFGMFWEHWGATVTKVSYQGIQYPYFEDAACDENSGEA